MTLEYNGTKYTVTNSSVYTDFSVLVKSLEEACEVVNAFEGMTAYTFSLVEYANMVVLKRMIVIDDDRIVVKVKLRQKSEKETIKEELESLKSAMGEIAQNTNKTTSAKINKLLAKGVE